MSVQVRWAVPDDWRAIRQVRLAALAGDPDAFGSTLARERAFTEDIWRGRLDNGMTFLGLLDGAPVGIAGAVTDPAEPGAWQLNGMWVSPAARGRGVGGALVEAVLAHAARLGPPAVRLWVMEGNHAAERLYAAHGFGRTGESVALPRDPARKKVAMRCGTAG